MLPLVTTARANGSPSQALPMVKTFACFTTRCVATLVAALNGVGGPVQFTVDLRPGRQLTTKFIETYC